MSLSPLRRTAATILGSLLLIVSVPLASAQAAPPARGGAGIASAHPLATHAGIEILQAGGNAFDAAVAVSAVLAVVEPYSSGIGGGGFWLLHRASDGFETMVDGRETAPAGASRRMYQDAQGKAIASLSRNGAIAGAIPGEPEALDWIAARYGKLGLARDLEPAIRIARDGFDIDPRFADYVAKEAGRLSPAAKAVFMPGGIPPAVGTHIRQPDLAATLQALATQGRAGFYTGTVADKLVAGVRADGGLWTAEDLKGYRVIEREPIRFSFRDYRITSGPPPTAGGVGLAEILQQLEARGWTGDDPRTAIPQVAEAMRRAYRDRAAYLGDPAFVSMPLTRLLSRTYALSLAQSTPADRATPSAALPPLEPAPGRAAVEGHETSHFSIIDGEGNRVAATITVNLRFGSGYMAPGTGVIVNDEMDDFAASTTDSNAFGLIGSRANEIAPGKRPLSSMTPSFVEGPQGVLVIGTPGGSRILTMVLLGILEFVRGADATRIVSAPRYHMQYLPDVLEYERGGWSTELEEAMRGRGYTLKASEPWGNLQAVLRRNGEADIDAAADPRGVGSAEKMLPSSP